jgi:hypothetical protein
MTAFISPYEWIRLSLHCEATGDTPDSVHARRRKRQWIDGVHCRLGPDGNLYVNPSEYNKWVASEKPAVAHSPRQSEKSTAHAE